MGVFLAAMTAALRSTLGRQLAGVYVHGSLSTGSFNPRTSDIDVLVTTRRLTDAPVNERLREDYARMRGWEQPGLADQLDAAFVPSAWLRAPGVPQAPVATVHPGEGFTVEPLGPEFVIQKHMVRVHGIRLAGRRPDQIAIAVTPAELRESQVGILRSWWVRQLEFPGRLLERSYQAYAVVTMCRALYLLATGEVVTKPEAAAWALQSPQLEPWHLLIAWALAYPGGGQPDQRIASIDFIRFTLDDAGISHDPPSS